MGNLGDGSHPFLIFLTFSCSDDQTITSIVGTGDNGEHGFCAAI